MPAMSASSSFFFVWGAPWNEWGLAQQLFLDSIFVHHPAASVFFIALNTDDALPPQFNQLADMGYIIHGVFLSYEQLMSPEWYVSQDNNLWLQSKLAAPAAAVQASKAELIAYLQFFLLYKYGGTFAFPDIVFVRPLPSHPLIPDYNATIAPLQHATPQTGMLRLQPASEFASSMLRIAFSPSSADNWYVCYKKLLQDVREGKAQIANASHIIPAQDIDPIQSTHVMRLFEVDSGSADTPLGWMYFQATRRHALAITLHSRITKGMIAAPDSVASYLIKYTSLTGRRCFITGPELVVATDSWTQLTGANAMFVTTCGGMTETRRVRLTLQVLAGSLSMCGQGPVAEIALESLRSLRDVNTALSLVKYQAKPGSSSGSLVILASVDNDPVLDKRIEVIVFQRMVTYVAHTNGRIHHIQSLHDSVQKFYPGTLVLASDDGENSTERGEMPGLPTLRWIVLPVDSGLSIGRNELILSARTPYVHVVDDDFTISSRSHFELLLEVLHTSSFDLASPRIPADVASGWSYRGLFSIDNKTLSLVRGLHGTHRGCEHVDFVPNVFMAKREALLRSPWDPELKLGEHEEFFLRLTQSGAKVLYCNDLEITHIQYQWWKYVNNDPNSYFVKRSRAIDFWRVALQKHGLERLFVFGFRRIPPMPPRVHVKANRTAARPPTP
jgi:glycosyltransferase involved in cell wall biosynthesis